jgi:hypothetical protein
VGASAPQRGHTPALPVAGAQACPSFAVSRERIASTVPGAVSSASRRTSSTSESTTARASGSTAAAWSRHESSRWGGQRISTRRAPIAFAVARATLDFPLPISPSTNAARPRRAWGLASSPPRSFTVAMTA